MLEKEPEETKVEKKEEAITNDYTNVDFEDLEDKTE